MGEHCDPNEFDLYGPVWILVTLVVEVSICNFILSGTNFDVAIETALTDA